jgi:hypothetical protein
MFLSFRAIVAAIGHQERSGIIMWVRIFLQLKQWITLEVVYSRDRKEGSKSNELPESDQ